MKEKDQMEQNSGELTKLKNEHRIFKHFNQDMTRKTIEDAADTDHLTAQTKLLHSTTPINTS